MAALVATPQLEGDKPLGLRSKVLWKNESGKTYLSGTVTTFEPSRRFALELHDVSWSRKALPGEVSYTLNLSENNKRTRVEFTLGDLAIDPEAQDWYDAYDQSHELEIIKELAES